MDVDLISAAVAVAGERRLPAEELLARDGCGWRLTMGGRYLEEEEGADY